MKAVFALVAVLAMVALAQSIPTLAYNGLGFGYGTGLGYGVRNYGLGYGTGLGYGLGYGVKNVGLGYGYGARAVGFGGYGLGVKNVGLNYGLGYAGFAKPALSYGYGF